MSDSPLLHPTKRATTLNGRGRGSMAFLEFGPQDRPADAVFLHANGFNALTYRHVLAPLAARYRILAIDQRGHGATDLTTLLEGRRDWLDLRDDLLAFLETMEASNVVLSGHSMGATAALLAAAAKPQCCRSLVLFDPVIPPSRRWSTTTEPGLAQAARRRRAVFASRDEALTSYRGRGAFRTWPEAMLADYIAAGFRTLPDGQISLACAPAWEASGYAAQEHDSWWALGQTSCAVAIHRAETASTFQPMENLLDLPDRVTITTAPGTTHFLPMERPDLVQAVLGEAIAATAAAETKISIPA